jgi:hypothetical protein
MVEKYFEEPLSLPETETKIITENKSEFLQKLNQVQSVLDEEKIPNRLLGGIAVASYLNTNLSRTDFDRKNIFTKDQRIPDIDLLVPRLQIQKAQNICGPIMNDSQFPVRVEFASGIEHMDFRPQEEYSYLFHKSLSVEIPTILFKPVTRNVAGIDITTVDPLTLFHTFGVWGGILREKDWKQLVPLRRAIENDLPTDFSEEDFDGFHKFLKQRHEEYPMYAFTRRVGTEIGKLLPDSVENVLRICNKISIENKSRQIKSEE